MDVTNCRSCGNLFNYLSGPPLCPVCRKKLEEKFQSTKNYIRENPGANINQISEECKVSIPQLKKWVREERLTFADNSPVGIECESCGKMIRTGRFCNDCKSKVINDLDNLYAKPEAPGPVKKKEKGKDRMRFLDN